MATMIAVIALVMSTMFGGVIYAADAAGPGDALYGVDLAVEGFRTQFAFNDTSLTNLKLKLASERLNEAAVELEGEANPDKIVVALTAFDEIIAELENLLATGNLSPEQQVEVEAAIAALQAAKQVTGLSQDDGDNLALDESELDDDNENGAINDNGDDDDDDNDNSSSNDNGDDDDDDDDNANSSSNGDDDDDEEEDD
jgi:hypothetical protein